MPGWVNLKCKASWITSWQLPNKDRPVPLSCQICQRLVDVTLQSAMGQAGDVQWVFKYPTKSPSIILFEIGYSKHLDSIHGWVTVITLEWQLLQIESNAIPRK